jgi:superfamily II DNA or RNA helicase
MTLNTRLKERIRILAIEFSRSTYSVKLEQEAHLYWPLLEFDEGGSLKEALCECEKLPCEHIELALKAVSRGFLRLHQMHERHLWHLLFFHLCHHWNWNDLSFTATDDGLLIEDDNQSMRLEAAHPDFAKAIEQLLQERPEENEHNSIKFSNLPYHEIKAWSNGTPGPWLTYELSLWSELAKLMFMHDVDRDPQYYVQLDRQDENYRLLIDAETYEVELFLDAQALLVVFESLHTLDSGLVGSTSWQDNLYSIQLENKRFSLEYFPDSQKQAQSILEKVKNLKNGWRLNEWAYLSDEGLWKIDPQEALWPNQLSQEQLAKVLNELTHTQILLSGFCVRFESIGLKYKIDFNTSGGLQISSYIWDLHEIENEDVLTFEDWAFHSQRGFQKLDLSNFIAPSTLTKDQVEGFIDENLELLQQWARFEVHTAGLAQTLNYKVEVENSLIFLDPLTSQPDIIAYGHWLYTETQGLFWQRSDFRHLHHELVVPWSQLAKFIDNHRNELNDVQEFWASRSPLQAQYLKLDWNGTELKLEPYNILYQSYQSQPVFFIKNYSFVPGEGFYELESSSLLPAGYDQTLKIDQEDLDEFLQNQWPLVWNYVEKIPHELNPIGEYHLAIYKTRTHKLEQGILGLQARIVTEHGAQELSSLLASKGNQNTFLSSAGLIDLKSSKWRWLHLCRLHQTDDDVWVEFTPLDLMRMRLDCTIDCEDPQVTQLLSGIIDKGQLPDISSLKSTLRPYQQLGVRWLWQLISYGLGALLCDDMGLGKTHQVMAVMAAMISQKKHCKILIACPTSVLYHWQDKLKDFLPSAKVQLFYGLNRTLVPDEMQVVLTSFGILRGSTELDEYQWDLCIFDEVQLAKNSKSQIWKACGRLKAFHKIGLSGTPIENSLKDLKAIFDVIFPGYLPLEGVFRGEYIHPIEKYRDPHALAQLKLLIEPLVLRRTKKEVLQDLPGKIEEVSHCEMSEEQHLLYKTTLNQSRSEVIDVLEDEEQPIPYMHVFSILNALKQICNHPACYWRNRDVAANLHEHQSGKWDLFKVILEEALASGQKVVVFSQYLAMLDLIEEYLTAHNVQYSSLRGSTRQRQEVVARFQNDEACRVFVSSLTAGGLGIDLTAGSVVILYDRWWNSARENQAVDRVHRIGQSRGVQVFRLITKNSLEERIDVMISRKAKLLEDITPADDPHTFKQFSREEILELLRYEPTNS